MRFVRTEVKRKTLFRYGLVGVAFLFYFYSVLSRIGHPISKDELYWVMAAKSLCLIGKPLLFDSDSPGALLVQSPHIYLYLLKFAFHLFGIHDTVARIPGILSGLASLILVFVMTKSFIRGPKEEGLFWAAVVTLLYATTPFMIQGSVIVGDDHTILIPAILFLLFSFVKSQEERKLKWALATGFAVAFAFGIRITTPTIVVVLLGTYALARRAPLRSKLTSVASMIGGIAVFLFLWFVYCRLKDIPFSGPFGYTLDAFRYRTSQAGGLHLSQFFQNFVYFVFWIGPVPALLFLVLGVRRGIHFLSHRHLSPEGIFLITGLAIVVGYSFVGGAPFGFPKYHSPGVALLYVFSGLALHQTHPSAFSGIRLWNVGMTLLTAFFIQIFTVSDFLYILRYQLREAVTFYPPSAHSSFLQGMTLKAILYFFLLTILFGTCLKFSFIQSPHALLLLLALGTNVAASFLQNSRGYQTGYNYGIRGTVEAARLIQERVTPKDFVLARDEINYYLNRLPSRGLVDQIWNDEKELTRIIRDPATGAFAYSIATNPVAQVKRFSGYEPLQRLLRQEFVPATVESFKIWIRKQR